MGIIAVFGGTFNPIHIGHIEIIKSLQSLSEIDKILLIPTNIPPHKYTNYLASAKDRYNMCEIISSDYDNVSVCDIELYREGKSYTIDTINALLKMYPDSELAITVGGDMIVSFDSWKSYLDIINKCKLITFRRVGVSDEDYINAINNLKHKGARIIELRQAITDISSTEIRSELTKGDACRALDERICEYIRTNNLYGV